jgi:hypothetical protein
MEPSRVECLIGVCFRSEHPGDGRAEAQVLARRRRLLLYALRLAGKGRQRPRGGARSVRALPRSTYQEQRQRRRDVDHSRPGRGRR